MKLLKYFILGLFLLNLSSIVFATSSAILGSVLSYASFLLIFAYYIFFLRGKPNYWLVYIGLAYFIISGLQMYKVIGDREFVILMIKFFILVLFGNSFFKTVTKKELMIFLMIGALTVILNLLLFSDEYGRYSGFYLNPNAAGLVCIVGYSLSFSIEDKRLKAVGQILFTIAGLATFSRTFMLLWVLVNLLSLRISIKNIRILGLGLGLAILLLIFGEVFNLGGLRFQQFRGILTNETSASDLQEGSRTETWALFYDEVLANPVLGDGFGKFQTRGLYRVGSHNTYLMVLGESGIIPFLALVTFILYIIIWSNKLFKVDPSLLLISTALGIYLATSHNFFDTYFKLCILMYVQGKIRQYREEPYNETITPLNHLGTKSNS